MLTSHSHATKAISVRTVQPGWRLVDAKDKILGKVATEVATYLQGKNKPKYSSNLDVGDHVVVINVAHIMITGRKGIQKIYTNYSGYPGGLRKEAFNDLLKRKPLDVARRAISGMLPKNKLRDRRLARLHLYVDDQNPYAQHFKV